MTSDRANDAIETALAKGYISSQQAIALQEELFMFPGSNVLSLMVRRGMISPEQAEVLKAKPTHNDIKPPADDEIDMDFGGGSSGGDFEILSGPAATFKREPVSPPQNSASALNRTSPELPARHSVTDALGAERNALQQPQHTLNPDGLQPDLQLLKLISSGREKGCSDLHLSVGKPPYLRIDGKISFLSEPALTAAKTERMCLSVLTAEQRAEFERAHQVDFSFDIPGSGRFRANVYRQRLGVEGAFRFIPLEVPNLSSLGLPAVLEKLTSYPQGLNLVTGPGGCGKTSTVAAMLEHINRHRHEHIITVEDPVEYVFHPNNCQVTQREVGTHTESFAHALRTALRQDPDVIMIGELRDFETTSISITAAETGHLVFGTLHTSSAARTVARILDVFPPSQRGQICLMIAESLRGIVSQQLIPRSDGKGRVCATEILLVTTGVSQVIKEGKTHQLISHMQSGRRQGMISMDDALMELFQAGLITEAEAYQRAENKGMFMLRSQ